MPTGSVKVVTKRQLRTGLWTFLSVSATIVVILLLSTIDNPDGSPWLESNLIGQSLALVGVVSAAVLPLLIGVRKDAAVARDQLENSHVEDPSRVSNVRDDLDTKHDAVMERLASFERAIERRFDTVGSDIRGVRRDIGRLWDKAEKTSDRVQRIEDTENPYGSPGK